jgi:hypothetical protein
MLVDFSDLASSAGMAKVQPRRDRAVGGQKDGDGWRAPLPWSG